MHEQKGKDNTGLPQTCSSQCKFQHPVHCECDDELAYIYSPSTVAPRILTVVERNTQYGEMKIHIMSVTECIVYMFRAMTI